MTRTLARFRPALGLPYQIRAFEARDARDPAPVALNELKTRCPDDTLIDILAVPPSART